MGVLIRLVERLQYVFWNGKQQVRLLLLQQRERGQVGFLHRHHRLLPDRQHQGHSYRPMLVDQLRTVLCLPVLHRLYPLPSTLTSSLQIQFVHPYINKKSVKQLTCSTPPQPTQLVHHVHATRSLSSISQMVNYPLSPPQMIQGPYTT